LDPEELGIFVKEVKAHKECIVSLSPIDMDIGGFVSCSLDNRVRLWSFNLDLWGTLDQKPVALETLDKRWCFPKEAREKK